MSPVEVFSERPRVVGVKGNIVTVDCGDTPLAKNEVAHVVRGEARLKGEVLRLRGRLAWLQLFEDTDDIQVGDAVEASGELLSVSLGPGLLGSVYDGLQNPLAELAARHGFFLPRGVELPGLDQERSWSFTPLVRAGDTVVPGGVLGVVPEGRFQHRILVPPDLAGPVQVVWIKGGTFTVADPVALLVTEDGREIRRTLEMRWPVRRPLAQDLLQRRIVHRLAPEEPLFTTVRIIDALFPVALGGTACIPGPFGAGKTVLQGLIARNAATDIVVMIACGERAGEVVDTINEFSRHRDPRTGTTLLQRSVIVCNTSSMPVAAREASLYTGITIGEYYRQMGYNVLVIADSTSRWAQAMRETSANLEEIPGEEAFPAYLDSSIKAVYERAGVVTCAGDTTGSLTMIGAVSPAGGNFEEPVTQSTLATVKTFLGLSYDRAYKRFYPAIDPLTSWSRYRERLAGWLDTHLHPRFTAMVAALETLLRRGDEVRRMIQVTGEEGVSLDDFVLLQKATMADMVFLQQDGFDPVDGATGAHRLAASLAMLHRLLAATYRFDDREAARAFFVELTGHFRNWNYAADSSPEYQRLAAVMTELAARHGAPMDLAAEEPEEEGEQQGDQQAGGDREVEAEVVPPHHDVAGQPAQGELGDQRPGETETDEDDTGDDEETGHGDDGT